MNHNCTLIWALLRAFAHQRTSGFHNQAIGMVCPLMTTISANAPLTRICAVYKTRPASTYKSPVTGTPRLQRFLKR